MGRKSLAGIAIAAALLLMGIGAATAGADTTPALTGQASPDDVAVVESAIAEVSGASVDVIDEAESPEADDESGDQQGPADESEESDDGAQAGNDQSSSDAGGDDAAGSEQGTATPAL